MMRVIGLMSGTSLDGVDAAWLETDGEQINAFGPSVTLPYEPELKTRLRRLLDAVGVPDPTDPTHLAGEVAAVTEALTCRHAEAVATLGRGADLIGMHGQTIRHQPEQGRTWQIGDGALLARL